MWLNYFTDPVLRAPTIGCMLMSLAASLVGVIAYLRKQSLLGESLSHAAYPGVIGGLLCAALFVSIGGNTSSSAILLWILGGGFLSAWLGVWVIDLLERYAKIRSDSALCFVLAVFFGFGLTLASRIQFTHTNLYKQSLTYFYGQAATMTDIHVWIYALLSLITISVIAFFYKELQVLTFDRQYAKSLGLPVNTLDTIFYTLIALAVVVGIRSVGVVLMSAMLIAPAVAARQYTNRLSMMLILSAIFAVASGFFGNMLSVQLTAELAELYPASRLVLPTGPMIVLVATSICIFSLFFAPERGLFIRYFRIAFFRYHCLGENILKTIWRLGPHKNVTLKQIQRYQHISTFYLFFILRQLALQGWIEKATSNSYRLTLDGEKRAAQIVRLHRLWELYLTDYIGIGAERVHRSAEEMEHILTPEIEKQLTLLLNDPKVDPHDQPIPPKSSTLPERDGTI